MLVAGLLTSTMFLGLVSPQQSLLFNFGETMKGPMGEIIIRNWRSLIGLSGIMLIYGAFAESVRKFVPVIACVSKTIFITLVLTYGQQYMAYGVGTAVIADIIMIVLFFAYLLLTIRRTNVSK